MNTLKKIRRLLEASRHDGLFVATLTDGHQVAVTRFELDALESAGRVEATWHLHRTERGEERLVSVPRG